MPRRRRSVPWSRRTCSSITTVRPSTPGRRVTAPRGAGADDPGEAPPIPDPGRVAEPVQSGDGDLVHGEELGLRDDQDLRGGRPPDSDPEAGRADGAGDA